MTSLEYRLEQHGPNFNRLTVIEDSFWRDKAYILFCKCTCACGNVVDVQVRDLLRGHTKSCGCLQREKVREAKITHGLKTHFLYATWSMKKQLCNNPKCKAYPNYGARGIKMCDAWNGDNPAPFILYILCALG